MPTHDDSALRADPQPDPESAEVFTAQDVAVAMRDAVYSFAAYLANGLPLTDDMELKRAADAFVAGVADGSLPWPPDVMAKAQEMAGLVEDEERGVDA